MVHDADHAPLATHNHVHWQYSQGKTCDFTEFSTKIHRNERLAASDVFHMVTESIKLFLFHYCTDV